MISRATASAGRGPTRLPPSAPAKTAAAKITMLRILMKKPPQLRLLLGRAFGPGKSARAGKPMSGRQVLPPGGSLFTLTAEPRASKRLLGHAALKVIEQL